MAFPPKKTLTKKPTDPGTEEAVSDSVTVSGPPVQADDTVTLKKADLQALIDASVAEAIKLVAPASQNQSTVDAMEIAKAVAMVLAANQNNTENTAHTARLKALQDKEARTEKCPTCGQAIAGCGGPWVHGKVGDVIKYSRNGQGMEYTILALDKGGYAVEDKRRVVIDEINHARMCVFPKNEENAEYFTGLRINGKLYCSNGPGHEIWVPAVNDFASKISEFESGEKRSRQQRKHVGSMGNGVVGPGGQNRSPSPSHFTA